MNDYSLHTLNDKEFENLVRDLLQKELGVYLETFKSGKDKGIDLRFSSSNKSEPILVVQAKHFLKSGFSQLLHHLEKIEFQKVTLLNPGRYILATSVPLSPDNKSKIKAVFGKYIISYSDILGAEDLNNRIQNNPDIEEKYYKLWISSTNILQSILKSAVKGRSEFQRESILRSISLFVPTKNVEKALNILRERKFLVIKGEPGIGKTTLAKYLLYHFLGQDFELISASEKIREAEELFINNKKQIFYFDDFLGANYVEIVQSKNTDSALLNFVDRIRSHEDKYLILTSRTTIVNQAKQLFQKLQQKVFDVSEHTLQVSDYSSLERAQILYNHIYFNNVGNDHRSEVKKDKFYWQIINHPNFNPRIIEFISDPFALESIVPKKYCEYILATLKNPSMIWKNAYDRQIDDYCRFLLATIFTFPDRTAESRIQAAYEERLKYEIGKNGFQRTNGGYHAKLYELLGGFLTREIQAGNEPTISFFNPSINDFFIGYLNEYPDEKWRIIESVTFLNQFTYRFKSAIQGGVTFSKSERSRLLEIFRSKEILLKTLPSENRELELAEAYLGLFDREDIRPEVIRLLNEAELDDTEVGDFRKIVSILEDVSFDPELKNFIIGNWPRWIFLLLRSATEENEFTQVDSLFGYFDQEKKSFCLTHVDAIQKIMDSYWEDNIDSFIDSDDDLSSCVDEEEAESIPDEIVSKAQKLNDLFYLKPSKAFSQIRDIDMDDILSSNKKRQADAYKDKGVPRIEEKKFDPTIVDALFDD